VIIDMHCHLDLYSDPYTVAKMCEEKGLYVLSVTTTPKAWNGTSRLTEGNHKIQTALGLHPQLAHQRSQELEQFDSLLPKVKYVGEIGLDGGKGFKDYWQLQLDVFRHILKSVNAAGGRIMSIHSRASANAVLDELLHVKGTPILHWFTGNKGELKRALERDCWFSVGPAMTATKKGQYLVSLIPKNRILTETDGPFPKIGGKSLMPWEVVESYADLGKIWNVSPEEVKYQVYSNFLHLLSIK
jgi:TatD DNase family protein